LSNHLYGNEFTEINPDHQIFKEDFTLLRREDAVRKRHVPSSGAS